MNASSVANLKLAWAILAVAAVCVAVCSSTEYGEDWPQFHLGPEHIGASPSTAPRTNQTAWMSEEIGAQEGSSVSVAEGRVYVNGVDSIVCLDQGTGEVLWNVSFEATPEICQVWGFSPVYDNGKVFASGAKTVCLDAATGDPLWSFVPPSGRGAVDGGPTVYDGKVVVSDWDGQHYHCLDEASGREIWNFTVEGNAQSTPAISDGRVVFGGWEWGLGGNLYCAYMEDGAIVWNITTENSPCGSAAILDGVVYATTYNFEGNGEIMALSLVDGSLLWENEIQRTDSTPTLAEGKVYVCGGCDGFSDLQTYCFNASTGALVWETDPEERIGEWRCSVAYADGLIFVKRSGDDAGICALDATTGELVWSYPGAGSAAAVAGGMVFSLGDGRVYAFGDVAASNGV